MGITCSVVNGDAEEGMPCAVAGPPYVAARWCMGGSARVASGGVCVGSETAAAAGLVGVECEKKRSSLPAETARVGAVMEKGSMR